MLNRLNHLAHAIEQQYDRLKWKLRTKLGIGPVKILPYDGYGTRSKATILGRIVADYTVSPATQTDSVWRNIVNMFRRFNSHEIPFATVQARYQNQRVVTQANDEGYFRVEIDLPAPLSTDRLWHEVELTLVNSPGPVVGPAIGQVMVPPARAEFGVISDLDDTVIQTNVLSILQTARNTFLHNAYSRLAFPGVAAFYEALQQGTGSGVNPIFYVSNMPWNLYDLMNDFFEIRHIPRGPMLLTDIGLTDSHFIREPGRLHKLEHIHRLLDTYPDLPFILIGDAGEEDPTIYFETLQRYAGRIKAVYIRDLPESKNQEAIRQLMIETTELGVDLVLVPDTLAAAIHAAQHGFITPEAVAIIQAEIETSD